MDGLDELLGVLVAAALEAGGAALAARDRGLSTETKADRSPVTDADRRAEAIILAAVAAHLPSLPIVAEERFAAGAVPDDLGRRFLLVDPIDGTREFIAGRDEFTVNAGLIEDGYPLAGVVYAPASDTMFVGSPAGAFRTIGGGAPERIAIRPCPQAPTALASRSHRTAETDAFLARHAITDVAACGSSLKFCRLAEGAADVYPCFGPTMQWDTAAGQAVLEAAGGRVERAGGGRLAYGRDMGSGAFRNPSFVALGAFNLPR